MDTTFGIIATALGEPNSYYLGEDAVLLQWLQSNHFETSDKEGCLSVVAPYGYVFVNDILFSLDSVEVENADRADLDCMAYVSLGTPQRDKMILALMCLQLLEPKKFSASGVPEYRIWQISVPQAA